MIWRSGFLVAGVWCCLSAGSVAWAQASPAGAPGQPAQTRAAAEPTMTVSVVVTNSAGQPVSGLSRADFSIKDDKQPQQILDFGAYGESTQAAGTQQALLVLDEVNTDFTHDSQARYQVEQFLRNQSAQLPLPVSIALLTDTNVTFSGAPSRDGKTLADDLKRTALNMRIIHRSAGFYGGEERTDISLRALGSLLHAEQGQPGRKLLIWISPGWPYLAYPGTSYSERQQHALFGSVNMIWRSFEQSHTVLYSVDPLGTDDSEGFQTTYYKNALKPAEKWSQATLSNLGVQVLAIQDGGLVLNSNNDIAREIGKCLQDATAYYTITIPRAVSETPGVFHALAVHVDKPGLSVRTVAGYYTR